MNHIHHVHVFASDLEQSIAFYKDIFGGEVVLDMDLAGARNVFMKIGRGRIHFYDQPPKNAVSGSIHHFGIQTDGIEDVIKKINEKGIKLKKEVTDFGFWKYVMVPAPDGVLIELFQVDKTKIPDEFKSYFE